MKLRKQIFGCYVNFLSLRFRRSDFFGCYRDCAISVLWLHEFRFFIFCVILGDGPKVAVLRSNALTFLLLVKDFDILFQDIASLVSSILFTKKFIGCDERWCISVIETINNFLHVGFCLISHTSMDFLLFLAWSEIHDLLISSAFMKLVGRWFVNRTMSNSVLNSLNRSCRKFHAFICSESYIYWRVFRHVCITGLLIELVGGKGSLVPCGLRDKMEVTVGDGPDRVVSLESSHTRMLI